MKNYIEKLPDGTSFEMVYVEGGLFVRGNNKSKYRSDKPAHQVLLDSYYIGKFLVTQALWEKVMGAEQNNSYTKGLNHPVESVSTEDCREFRAKLMELTGKDYRFPTDAEWLYAAKGGKYSKDYLYAGSNDLNEVGWSKENSDMTTHPVGEKKSNELGIYDMSGNVNEWCLDWHHQDYYSRCARGFPIYNPIDLKATKASLYPASILVRGGCFLNPEIYSRIDFRLGSPGKNINIGMRLCYRPKSFEGIMEIKSAKQSETAPGPSH